MTLVLCGVALDETPPEDAAADGGSVRLLTAERVPLTLPVVGLGERGLAYAIDLSIIVACAFALLFVYNFWGDIERDLGALSRLGWLLLVATGFLLVAGYDMVGDLVFAGQTPGKRLLGIRVVGEGGLAPDPLASFARNALRLLDVLPLGYGVGTVAVFLTGAQRLGDLVAGTVVIRDKPRTLPWLATLADATGEPAWRIGEEQAADVLAFFDRSEHLTDVAKARRAARWLHKKAGLEVAPEQALAVLTEALAHAAERPGSKLGLMRDLARAAHALDEAVAGFAKAPSERLAHALDDGIRAAAALLLRAEGRATGPAVHQLSLSLLAAERLRHRGDRRKRTLGQLLFTDVPVTVYQERNNIGRAAGVLFGSAALAFAMAYMDVNVARALVGDDLAAMIEGGASWTDRIEQQGHFSRAALQIIVNNVRVGILCFGAGLLGGMGTLLLLFFNGFHLGAVFGHAASLGVGGTLGTFILAHGPVELTSICVAAAGGLVLGRGIFSPGPRPRLDALREEGARGVRLLLGATMGFVFIGTVEGFISPGKLFPWPVNALVGLCTFGAFFFYVQRKGRSAAG